GERERHFASGRDQNLFGPDHELAGAAEIAGDFFSQSGDAASGAIAIAARSDRVADSVDNRSGRVKVRFAEFEVDDGAALFFKFLGAREDRESAFASELADTRGDATGSHGGSLAEDGERMS